MYTPRPYPLERDPSRYPEQEKREVNGTLIHRGPCSLPRSSIPSPLLTGTLLKCQGLPSVFSTVILGHVSAGKRNPLFLYHLRVRFHIYRSMSLPDTIVGTPSLKELLHLSHPTSKSLSIHPNCKLFSLFSDFTF